jgi:hypothetical protein
LVAIDLADEDIGRVDHETSRRTRVGVCRNRNFATAANRGSLSASFNS